MTIRVALLRSIVIRGQRVRMDVARGWVEDAGGTEVASIIATGNLVFRSRKATARLERELEAACAKSYGQRTELIVRTSDEWRELLGANPFRKEAMKAPARLIVWAMRTPLPDAGLAQLQRRAAAHEKIVRTAKGDFYIWFGEDSALETKIPAGFGLKSLGAVGTNRNWNTALKITAALDAIEGR